MWQLINVVLVPSPSSLLRTHVFLVSLVPCTISGVLAAANPSHWQL